MNLKNTFFFKSQYFYYNRIPVNNFGERAVEIPLAFNFLAHLDRKSKILEVGNVLGLYENSLSEYVGIRTRRIVDKFEQDIGIDNVDFMDLPSEEKYDVIVSVSTVEHIGQGIEPSGSYGEQIEARDTEVPLKAIAKIYDLLLTHGKALITVPFGKLIDGEWYIQFSSDYLNLLVSKYNIPQEALCTTFLRRLSLEPPISNPRQIWVEFEESQLSDVDYNWPWPCANAIAVIELNKITSNFSLQLDLSATPLSYCKTIYKKPIIYSGLIEDDFLSLLKGLRSINFVIFPDWLQQEESLYSDIERVVRAILNHPDKNNILLLILASNISEEDAELVLADITMNLLIQGDVAEADEAGIFLLKKMSRVQWAALSNLIYSRILLEKENRQEILHAKAEKLSVVEADSLSNRRIINLKTGLCDFK